MPVINVSVECPVYNSFKVQQVAGLFDVPIAQKMRRDFAVEIPGLEESWQIGAIVGPSGSGKSTVARQAFGSSLWDSAKAVWPDDRAVIDCFESSTKVTTQMLTAVGFSSPPSWIKPYRVLSNGEKFRCDLVRALLSPGDVVAYDEFSSFVDRTVAKIGSAAIAKAIRGDRINKRLVAVSCHSDILEWLCPDWVVDMATCQLARGSLQRPDITLEVVRCDRAAWRLFAKHHYLGASLHQSAQCYMALWNGDPVSFCAMLANFGWKDFWRIARIVTLPDYQGIGIGTRFMEGVAALYKRQGKRVSIVASNPAVIRHCEKSSLWTLMAVKKTGNNKQTAQVSGGKERAVSLGRAVVSFEFRGPNR